MVWDPFYFLFALIYPIFIFKICIIPHSYSAKSFLSCLFISCLLYNILFKYSIQKKHCQCKFVQAQIGIHIYSTISSVDILSKSNIINTNLYRLKSRFMFIIQYSIWIRYPRKSLPMLVCVGPNQDSCLLYNILFR